LIFRNECNSCAEGACEKLIKVEGGDYDGGKGRCLAGFI
jgi:hypothetical protein